MAEKGAGRRKGVPGEGLKAGNRGRFREDRKAVKSASSLRGQEPKMQLRWWAGPGSRALGRPGWELSPGGDREPWTVVVGSGRQRVPSGALWGMDAGGGCPSWGWDLADPKEGVGQRM